MRNSFVDYLNTLHNANGSNLNALAESQAVNPFYETIKVHRRIGDRIAELVRGEPQCIILTGHAGDGKTGLLQQILIELGATEPSVPIPPYATVTIPNGGRALFFVKDMSELAATAQERLLLEALRAPERGSSSILVSNTGPLLHTFRRLQDTARLPGSFRDFQSQLLSSMDASEPTSVSLKEYTFTLVNMARVDNVGMAGLLLKKMINDDAWAPCQSCSARNKCPVFNNVRTIRASFQRTRDFVETCLLWLQEHDSRLTLRQIIAHLAYAVTSNLSCERVHNLPDSKWTLFKYHFANAFWGFHGTTEDISSVQVRGIQTLRSLGLDETSIPDDYALFVRKDITLFDSETADLVDGILRGTIFPSPNEARVADPGIRRSVRRFYFLFASLQSPAEYENLLASLFSPVLPTYLRIRYGNVQKADLRFVEQWVARGLYRSIAGIPRPESMDRIHLTLRPDRPGISGVQLLLGEVSDKELVIYAKRVESYGDYLDDRYSHLLVLQLRNSHDEHIISLPLLDHLYRLGEGAISTRLNPYLSHGIDRIKASLMNCARASSDDVRLLILAPDGPRTIDITIEDDRLVVS